MRKKVLIVEDYEDSRSFMKFLVESYGYQVVEAADGIEAVDRYKQQHPDLVLMDISLPVVDGLTATKAIREFEEASKLPIIAVTAFGKSFYNQAIEAGCNDLINKPIDFDTLEPILNQYLQRNLIIDFAPRSVAARAVMESQLKAFENYIASLANLGVFPSLHRHYNGWTCILRNAANKQLMPFEGETPCWGETAMDALTGAVEALNQRFNEPRLLHKYIDTGIDPRTETFQTVKSVYTQ